MMTEAQLKAELRRVADEHATRIIELWEIIDERDGTIAELKQKMIGHEAKPHTSEPLWSDKRIANYAEAMDMYEVQSLLTQVRDEYEREIVYYRSVASGQAQGREPLYDLAARMARLERRVSNMEGE